MTETITLPPESDLAKAVKASKAPAISRASPLSPRPSARAVNAVAAIDRPMATDVLKNSRVPA